MKSEWKVSSQILSEKVYIVYRLKDVSQVDHSGNREYHGDYTPDKQAAYDLADKLNKEEERKLGQE